MERRKVFIMMCVIWCGVLRASNRTAVGKSFSTFLEALEESVKWVAAFPSGNVSVQTGSLGWLEGRRWVFLKVTCNREVFEARIGDLSLGNVPLNEGLRSFIEEKARDIRQARLLRPQTTG